ncbi:MAG: hypothetical protein J5612_05890 [Paludibacteraceae bacterium]|nr:hypothetical protein [Paludibacteraceae bacterium]
MALLASAVVSIHAKVTKEYQRPSLHLVLLTATEEASVGTLIITDKEILKAVEESWTNYEFPALYNNFAIPFVRKDVGAAKGSIMEVMAEYGKPGALDNLDAGGLASILAMLDGKEYREALRKEIEASEGEIAHQLVRKWWSISDDGEVSDTLLFKLACYSATQNQANASAETVLGAQVSLFNELADATMANTFVAFSKVDFYSSEPIAAFTKNIMLKIGEVAGTSSLTDIAAIATYEKMKQGYSAFTNALLYKLQWNDSIAGQFYTIWKDGSHIDMEKFNNMPFHLEYVGGTNSKATCIPKKDDQGKEVAHMVFKTIHRALNNQFNKMQNAYEEFRPMVPVLGIDAKGGIIADMGTKEGIKAGDSFRLYEPFVNEKGITKYKYIGIVKVVKWSGDQFVNGVWDNENIDNAAEADLNGDNLEIVGTHLSKFKNATPSMFVKKGKK